MVVRVVESESVSAATSRAWALVRSGGSRRHPPLLATPPGSSPAAGGATVGLPKLRPLPHRSGKVAGAVSPTVTIGAHSAILTRDVPIDFRALDFPSRRHGCAGLAWTFSVATVMSAHMHDSTSR